MTRIEWHLKGRIGRKQDRSSLCRIAMRVLELGAIGGRLPQMLDSVDSINRPKRRSLHQKKLSSCDIDRDLDLFIVHNLASLPRSPLLSDRDRRTAFNVALD